MHWLLRFPAPISFLIVSTVTVAVILGALYCLRLRFPAEVLKENQDVAAIIFNAFGLLYAVIVAFVVFVTWTGYDEARKNLELEASEAIDIFRNAEAFPPPLNQQVRTALLGYVQSVVDDELNRLATENITLATGGKVREITRLFNRMDPQQVANRELYAESLKRLNDLAQYRRLRIFSGNNSVPPAIWLVLLIGGAITAGYTFLFGTRNPLAHYAMTAGLTLTVTLILFLIYILDHPFTGANRITALPLHEAIAVMERDAAEAPH